MSNVLALNTGPVVRLTKSFLQFVDARSLLGFLNTCCGDDRRDAICAAFVKFASEEQLIAKSPHGYYSSNDLLAKARYFFPLERQHLGADVATIMTKLLETFARNGISFEPMFSSKTASASIHQIGERRP
jgi:hypothetical protein